MTIDYRDEWVLSGTNRGSWYSEIRERFIERLRVRPDLVVISSVESMSLRHVQLSWFGTAEIRGVLTEAAHAAGVAAELRSKADITRALNPPRKKGDPKQRPGADFEEDEAFWSSVFSGTLQKKYRQAALLAYSRAVQS